GLDGGVGRTEGRHHQDARPARDTAAMLEHLHAVDPRHREVGEDDVEGGRVLLRDSPDRLGARGRGRDLMPGSTEPDLEKPSHPALVVDDEDTADGFGAHSTTIARGGAGTRVGALGGWGAGAADRAGSSSKAQPTTTGDAR